MAGCFLRANSVTFSVGDFWGDAAQKAARTTKAEWRDPLPAIVDFNNGLEEAGVKLLLVPVPPKVAVYPDKLHADFDAGQRIDKAPSGFLRAASRGRGCCTRPVPRAGKRQTGSQRVVARALL